jgi:hypothetical protein
VAQAAAFFMRDARLSEPSGRSGVFHVSTRSRFMNTQALLFTAINLAAGLCALAIAHFYYLPHLQKGATSMLQSYHVVETNATYR